MESPCEIAAKIDALNLWEQLEPVNFAICPKGTVFPYFCTVLPEMKDYIRHIIMFLEGWQTFHEYIGFKADRFFGYHSSPLEFTQYNVSYPVAGGIRLGRHDSGRVPVLLPKADEPMCAKLLWQFYGVALRLESDPKLPLRFADSESMFARVEAADGSWTDQPLKIQQPATLVEDVPVDASEMKKAKDLPVDPARAISVDFRLTIDLVTRDPRPGVVYELRGVDSKTGARLITSRMSVGADGTMKGMWEHLPGQLVHEFIGLGYIPGEVRVRSGRVFRLVRRLCLDLQFKISLHDDLPELQ